MIGKEVRLGDGFGIIILIIVIAMFIIFGLFLYNIIGENGQKNKCESIGGDYIWGDLTCIKLVDGNYREGYIREINGNLRFIVGGS